ncbi:hypothetical protein GS482_10750 [Rhodococcus hoagii]|nr:hypothetical protein [Prescottella equi]
MESVRRAWEGLFVRAARGALVRARGGSDEHRLLSEQTDIVWAAMRWATRPARLLGPGGRVSTAGRIGQAAYDMVTTTGIPLTRGGPERCALA